MQCSKKVLLDHLVGELLELPWHLQAERLRGLEVDHKLELSHLHNRQVCRLLTFENTTNIAAYESIHLRYASPIAH